MSAWVGDSGNGYGCSDSDADADLPGKYLANRLSHVRQRNSVPLESTVSLEQPSFKETSSVKRFHR